MQGMKSPPCSPPSYREAPQQIYQEQCRTVSWATSLHVSKSHRAGKKSLNHLTVLLSLPHRQWQQTRSHREKGSTAGRDDMGRCCLPRRNIPHAQYLRLFSQLLPSSWRTDWKQSSNKGKGVIPGKSSRSLQTANWCSHPFLDITKHCMSWQLFTLHNKNLSM